jgi:hypothetical protein
MSNAAMVLGSLVFLFVFSFFVAGFTGTTLSLISPITLGVSGGLLAVVIGAANTPIAKGVAMAILFGDIFFHFIFSGIDPLILGLVIAPIILALGLAMAEIGQG